VICKWQHTLCKGTQTTPTVLGQQPSNNKKEKTCWLHIIPYHTIHTYMGNYSANNSGSLLYLTTIIFCHLIPPHTNIHWANRKWQV